MNKKALGIRWLWWSFRILLFFVMFMFIFIILRSQVISKNIDPGSIEYDVLINRIHKTFAYTSPNTGRIYPSIIDIRKFNSEILNNSFSTAKSLGIKLSLTNTNPIYFNKEFYEFVEPLRGTISKYKEISYSSPVSILTRENKLTSGKIDIVIMYEGR